jgi:O-antigen/teichoic acid export membrane protein
MQAVNSLRKLMPAGSLGRVLIIGSAAGATLHGTGMVLGLANSIILAWALGPAGLGIYTFALAIASTVGLLAGPGLAQFVMREFAAADARRDYATMKGLLRFANVFVLATTLAILAAGLLVAPLLELETQPYYAASVAALLLVPLQALNGLRAACQVALRKFVQGQSPERAIQPGLMLVFLLSAYVWRPDWLSPENAIGLMIAATGVSFAVGSLFLWRALPGPVRAATPTYLVKDWLTGLVPMSLYAFIWTLNSVGTTLLLGVLATPEAVGLFRVAQSGANLAQYAKTAMRQVVSPEISRLWSLQDAQRLQKLLAWSARLSLAIASGVFLVFAVYGAHLIDLVFGDAFSGAVLALIILTAGSVIDSACGFQIALLTMTSHASTVTRVLAVLSVIGLVVVSLLIHAAGLEGAAIGVTFYLAALNLTLLVLARRKTGFYAGAIPWPFPAGTTMPARVQ